jgi:hypothetical protein
LNAQPNRLKARINLTLDPQTIERLTEIQGRQELDSLSAAVRYAARFTHESFTTKPKRTAKEMR